VWYLVGLGYLFVPPTFLLAALLDPTEVEIHYWLSGQVHHGGYLALDGRFRWHGFDMHTFGTVMFGLERNGFYEYHDGYEMIWFDTL